MDASTHVVVAMSGGVDSSVAAALLVQQGCRVTGMMLRLWSEPGNEVANRCCTPEAMAMARRVARQLDIPFYALDAQNVFRQQVVQSFIDGYLQGGTPNPCLVCNQRIRWGFLLEHARTLGADWMATGHYARLETDLAGKVHLQRGADPQKDQSYVLHVLNQVQLRQASFPLGGYTKAEVRQLARDFHLPVSERPESQDLCFLGSDDYRQFLLRQAPAAANPGPILGRDGRQMGTHQGLAFYTIGQRKGLGIAAPQPLYVLEKDLSRNVLIVGTQEELGKKTLFASQVKWVLGEPPEAPFRAQVKIRYKAADAWGKVIPMGGDRVQVQFDQPLRDITPGQAAVFFQERECLGGGIIEQEPPLPLDLG
jgi:tRNA-specific 2-thiouridylase